MRPDENAKMKTAQETEADLDDEGDAQGPSAKKARYKKTEFISDEAEEADSEEEEEEEEEEELGEGGGDDDDDDDFAGFS